jgi:hypothetical protein
VLFHYTHSRPRSQYEFLSAWATSTSPEFRIILVFWTNMIPRARTMDKTVGGGAGGNCWLGLTCLYHLCSWQTHESKDAGCWTIRLWVTVLNGLSNPKSNFSQIALQVTWWRGYFTR